MQARNVGERVCETTKSKMQDADKILGWAPIAEIVHRRHGVVLSKDDVRDIMLAATSLLRGKCYICGVREPEPHHTHGRIGDLVNDKRWIVPLCRQHHDWCHRNIEEARAAFLLAELGGWNTQPAKRHGA